MKACSDCRLLQAVYPSFDCDEPFVLPSRHHHHVGYHTIATDDGVIGIFTGLSRFLGQPDAMHHHRSVNRTDVHDCIWNNEQLRTLSISWE
jgi:hypothetical protein